MGSGPTDLGGATVYVAPLGANPADPSAWTPMGVEPEASFTFTAHDDDPVWHLLTGSFTRDFRHVPKPRYPSCVHPGFNRALTQKGDTHGLPPRRD